MKKDAWFVNFTNHPSSMWSPEQTRAANIYGNIIDVPFPSIDPHMLEPGIWKIGNTVVEEIMRHNPTAVLCQGEFSLSFHVVRELLKRNVNVFCTCSERKVNEVYDADGRLTKTSHFQFVMFRKYFAP